MPRLLPSAVLAVICSLLAIVGDASGQPAEQRLWRDTTGKFQIQAKLIEQSGVSVRLHTSDGRELTVPFERLSREDQEYLRTRSAPGENPFAGGTPISPTSPVRATPPAATFPGTLRAVPESKSVGEEMALPGTGTTLDLAAEPSPTEFSPDSPPARPVTPAAVVAVSPIDAYDDVSVPVPADAAGNRFLVSIGRNKSGKPEETRGRIYAVDLAAKRAVLVWDQPRAVRVWDHDAGSGRTLIVDGLDQFDRGGELVMVEGLEAGSPRPLYRRTLPGAGKPGFAPQVEWARLLSGSHAAAIVDRVLCVWDLPAARLLYRVESASASEPPALSGNLRYMAVPQGGKVIVVETATGTVRRTIATGSTLTPGVAFDPDGRRLALCFSNQYRVWDCVADTLASEATTTDHLGSHPIAWISPRMFRSPLGSVVHLDLGMSVWKYTTSASTAPILSGDKLVVATTSGNCAVASTAIPHASAEKSVDQLMRAGDAAMLVRPGSAVTIAVESSESVDQAELKSALASAAESAGWKVADRAPITLVAKIGRGPAQQLSYRSMRGDSRNVSTASLTPFTAELEIRRGSTVLWTRSTINRVPTLLHLEEGETVQDAVKRYEKPDAAFFSRLTLPPRIPKPEVSERIGMSVLKEGAWQDLDINITRKSAGTR